MLREAKIFFVHFIHKCYPSSQFIQWFGATQTICPASYAVLCKCCVCTASDIQFNFGLLPIPGLNYIMANICPTTYSGKKKKRGAHINTQYTRFVTIRRIDAYYRHKTSTRTQHRQRGETDCLGAGAFVQLRCYTESLAKFFSGKSIPSSNFPIQQNTISNDSVDVRFLFQFFLHSLCVLCRAISPSVNG